MTLLCRLKALATRHRSLLPEPVWQNLRTIWFRLSPWFVRSRQTTHRYAGHPLKVWITDPIARDWYDGDWSEPTEISFLREAARRRGTGGMGPGSLVFDLGAHQGVVAMIMARLTEPAGRVVALEADPRNAALARKNIAANRLEDRITTLCAAAGPRDGSITFSQGFNGHVSGHASTGSTTIPMRCVDSLAREYGMPSVVYIDVEGFELEVLRGASAVLAGRSADIFIEVHSAEDRRKFDASVENIVELLPASTYDLHAMDPDATPGTGFMPLADCADLVASGRRFYLAALWKCPPPPGSP